MEPQAPAQYDESKIITLSSLEHIRKRPGMYIGRLGNGSQAGDGIYILLKEIIDNAVDEFIMGHGKRIDITLSDRELTVRDYGRGIPLGKLVECVSSINTGAKYNNDVFQFSVGLNGVGTKAVNALSSEFEIRAYREGKSAVAFFKEGVLQKEQQELSASEKNGTFVRFRPDETLFPRFQYDLRIIEKQLWNYAYLNRGLALYFNGTKFKSERGLADLLEKEVGEQALYDVVHIRQDLLEFAITHTDRYGETNFSFVNGHFTSDGGSHLSAFREGILKGINEFYKGSYQGPDVREGAVCAVAVKVQEPIFESQTKNKLGNTDLRWIVPAVRDSFVDALFKHPDAAEALKRKVQMNEKVRKELSNVKKAVRENAKKTSLAIPNLKDCKFHRGDAKGRGNESLIFLTEGQSAGGSMISSRDVLTQAIFCLKGKPLNCFGQGREALYKNVELYNIMKTLGIEDSVDDLRYEKVVLATDADVDGLHIRNLLITFFLQYFEDLVLRGHLFILETPLFRVRNQKEVRYCYNDHEKEAAAQELRKGKHLEITRFKGLGEISPKEFGQFIGPDIRLLSVRVEHIHEVEGLLSFYMGSNTSERKQYIMEHLI
jgi:topoisomerase-4 subunit B